MIQELDLFSFSTPKFKIDRPVRLIELFAGIGSQAKALQNLGVNYEHWFVCEIDKYAIASYNAIFNTNFETRDIKTVHADELKITEREIHLPMYILFSLPRFEPCRLKKRDDQGHRNKKWPTLGSRKIARGMHRTATDSSDGKCATSNR